MPELPEVETVRRGLLELVVGETVVSETHDWPKSFPNSKSDVKQFLMGATISDVRRRAKVLIIDLDSDYSLIVHLKMTGQMVFVGNKSQSREPKVVSRETRHRIRSSRVRSCDPQLKSHVSGESKIRFGAGHPNDSLIGELPDRSTRVTLTMKSGGKLFFNDQRKFGWMRLLPTAQLPEVDFLKKIGPEPLEDSFGSKEFIAQVRRRNRASIKAAMLDQTVVAGVGNIYADESLWAAKIHPATKVSDVSDVKLATLLKELKSILKLSIEKGGSSDKNYVNAEGKKGSYIDFVQVFRREGQDCSRCGAEIIKTRVAGRGTHVCLKCQK